MGKRIRKIFIGFLIGGCAVGLITSSASLFNYSNAVETKASSVTFSSVAWDNIDYSGGGVEIPDVVSYIPKSGYLALIAFSEYFNPVQTENIAYTQPVYSSHIKINGVPINQLENCICQLYVGNLLIYFPDNQLQYTSDYFRPTIEIDEETTFFSSILPYLRLEFKGKLGEHTRWKNATNDVKNNVNYSAIAWNNTDYGYMGGKNGLLLSYSDNLSVGSDEIDGSNKNRNLKNTAFGQNVRLNGTPFSEIEGAEITYYAQNHIWFYAPDMTTPINNQYPKIEIRGGEFFDKVIPSLSLYFVDDLWVDTLQEVSFVDIAWNNTEWNANPIAPDIVNNVPTQGYSILLRYNSNLGEVSNTNFANEDYDIGHHLKINGIPCKDVSGALVGLYYFTDMLYIYVPDSSLTYHDCYYRPTIEIEKCLLGNYLLPNNTFEFHGILAQDNQWGEITNKQYSENPFSVISWNNMDYGYMDGKKGLLLSFSNYLSLSNTEIEGGIKSKNFHQNQIGHNILLNGLPIDGIDGGEVIYYAQNHLWIYSPEMTTPSNGYMIPHLCISVPTNFLDTNLPCIHFNFIAGQWVLDENIYYNQSSFVSFFNEYNNFDMNNGYRQSILVFDRNLSSESNIDLIATNSEFVNQVTLNGIALKNVPGIFVIYMGNNYINLMIRNADIKNNGNRLSIPQDTRIFDYHINTVDLFLNDINGQWLSFDDCLISTSKKASFDLYKGLMNTAGLTFSHQINKVLYDDLLKDNDVTEVEIGSYIIPKNNYIDSGEKSIVAYIERNEPSGSTYAKIVNTNKDFINESTASTDGYYEYKTSMYNIKESHYADGYIGVGYIKLGNRTYYGNKTDSSTTFYELMVDAYQKSIIDDRYFASIISFETTNNAFELIDNSVNGSNHEPISFVTQGYYYLESNCNIRTMVIDGVPYKVNISQNSSTFFSYYNGVIDFKSEVKMTKGIGETMYELFRDSTNSNMNLNTPNNVSSLNQLFGSNAERIWFDTRTSLSADSAMGISLVNKDTGELDFNPEKVAELHDILGQFREKGITDLTLYLQGWALPYDAPVILKDNTWYSYDEGIHLEGASFKDIIPSQNSESYQNWLEANEKLAYKLAKEFPEIKSIEAMNEFDIKGYMHDPNYVTSSTITNINTTAKWAMDFCHALSKGIKKAGSTIKVMTPALTCVDTTETKHYNSKSFLQACYSYIENSDDKNTNNWFTVVNLHPYVFPTRNNSGEDSVYLWNNRPNRYSPSSIDNSDYDTDWLNYMNSFHDTIMGQHNDIKKGIAITEFGLSDMSGTTDSYWRYMNYNNRLNTIANKIFSKLNSINYITTFIWFRLFDFPVGDDKAAFACLEPNFGLVETDKTLKELGKIVYQYFNNGSTDYSLINAFLSTMKGRDE